MVPPQEENIFPLYTAKYYKLEGRDCESLSVLLMCLITINSGIKRICIHLF